MARDYSSDFVIVDHENGNTVDAHISMNNPLRYGGQTFYQSGYHPLGNGVEATTFQVVTNSGWMIPYVSCMIVAVGMLAQFLITLTRFLNRRAKQPDLSEGEGVQPVFDDKPDSNEQRIPAKARSLVSDTFGPKSLGLKNLQPAIWFPLVVALIVCVYLGSKMIVRRPADDQMNLYAFGQIPVRDEGRLKPIDSVARNTLRFLSRRVEFEDLNENKQPAIRFLLDVMTPVDAEAAAAEVPVEMQTKGDVHPVFYIENLDVQDFLDLEKRKGFKYSYEELQPRLNKLVTHLRQLEEKKAAQDAREEKGEEAEEEEGIEQEYASLMNLKLRELFSKVNRYRSLKESFIPLQVTSDLVPGPQELAINPRESVQRYLAFERLWTDYPEHLEQAKAPLVIPVMNSAGDDPDYAGKWQSYPWSYVKSQIAPGMYELRQALYDRGLLKQEPEAPPSQPNPLVEQFTKIREAYAKGPDGTDEFNQAVGSYLAFLGKSPPPDLDSSRIAYEAYFNATSIYYYAAVVSLFAFILGLGSWIGWSEPLRRATFWIVAVLLVVHTYGLVSRIYISGRPPVTNLYSSAIFIGWGAIALGLLMEWLYPIGIAVVISSALSFGTLLIAQFLSIGGDTIGVLQAVLDTQFWLATHVVCITLGYATTFVAGFLGLAYFVRGMLTPTLTRPLARDLARMIYGILCFAIFFSFVGTVLGGLWADDSWGRFWGWDPKENGALIIVLWNALVLHARWGGMVKDRGLAVLAMGGNIVTSWSWFGVNELGVGLHSYGFTDGVLQALAIFFFIQIAIIAVAAAIPQKEWWSFRAQRAGTNR
jgi:ABC-type transport system involved in cytochrome c biogenesis permease subunit